MGVGFRHFGVVRCVRPVRPIMLPWWSRWWSTWWSPWVLFRGAATPHPPRIAAAIARYLPSLPSDSTFHLRRADGGGCSAQAWGAQWQGAGGGGRFGPGWRVGASGAGFGAWCGSRRRAALGFSAGTPIRVRALGCGESGPGFAVRSPGGENPEQRSAGAELGQAVARGGGSVDVKQLAALREAHDSLIALEPLAGVVAALAPFPMVRRVRGVSSCKRNIYC